MELVAVREASKIKNPVREANENCILRLVMNMNRRHQSKPENCPG